MAMAADRDRLLSELMRAGCVEIRDPGDHLTDPAWASLVKRSGSDLTAVRTRLSDLNRALDGLKRYAGIKSSALAPRPELTQDEFLGDQDRQQAEEVCARILKLLEEHSNLESGESRLQTACASMEPWRSLELPLEQSGTEHVLYRLCVCPARVNLGDVRTKLGGSELAAELLNVSQDRQQHYLLLVCHRADEREVMELLRPYSFSAVSFPGVSGTPAQELDRLSGELAENRRRQEEIGSEITACKDAAPALQLLADRLSVEAFKSQETEQVLTDGTIVFFEGWAPAESMDQVAAVLDGMGCAWDARDPTEEEVPEVPVKLKNSIFSRCMNVVTEMYSLPAYDGTDPNPLMAPFFILFFGVMMADVAYGLLMILGALFVLKKTRPREGTRNFMELVFWCGVSTIVVGAMTGGFLGDFIPQIIKIMDPTSTFEMPALFTPLNDTVAIMLGSLVLGAIQVFTGMAVSVINKIRAGEFIDALFDEITWWIILAGVGLAIFGIGTVGSVPVPLTVGGLMLVFGGTRKAKGFGKLTTLVGLVYNGVTGFFSDILSYVRLMALMLSGSVIASVFNTLGATFGSVILFIPISLIGNALNLALNLLGCYVHDLRLQCLEFFNRFYKEGGKPFKPLAIQTKYVDVIKEEQ